MNRLIIIVLFALSLGTASAAEPPATIPLPETPVGRTFSNFLTALNSGDSTQWTTFLAHHPPAQPNDSADLQARRLGLMQMVYGDFGGLEPVQIVASSDFQLSVVLVGRASANYVRLDFTVTEQPPYVWARMRAEVLDEDPFAPPPPAFASDIQLAAWIDSIVSSMADADEFSGTVLLAKDGAPFYTRAVGVANRRYDVSNRPDTKFNLGSMNKMFTGVAIAQLAQQGKLRFEDPIIKHIPDYPDKEIAERVTIHHLLTHTSGMSSYWEELFDTSFWEIKTVDGYFSLIKGKPLEFEPGAQWSYSNSGPIILGLIIERISGQSYYDYVRDHIYIPAGMPNTDCYELDIPTPNLAIGYTRMASDGRRDTLWHANYFMHAVKGGPAGGGYSTVEDLLAFDKALRAHKLLNQAFTDTVITGRAAMAPGPPPPSGAPQQSDEMYAYLFGDMKVNGHRIVGHSGGAPGINAVLDMYWDDGYTVAVMANIDGAASRLARKIQTSLTR